MHQLVNEARRKRRSASDCLIAAADMTTWEKFRPWVDAVCPLVQIVKIGMALATSEVGERDAISYVKELYPGMQFMLDRKMHEIPANMAQAMKAAVALGNTWGVTIHASSGAKAIQEVRKVNSLARVIAVTVLTTMDEAECQRIYGTNVQQTVLRFADEAREGGADALVCAPSEIGLLREHQRFDGVEIITPNVRPDWAVVSGDDQNAARQMTPGDAIRAGADYVVVGRPLVGTFERASGPERTVPLILEEIAAALQARDRV